jgi:hypothetical protein
VAGLVLSGGSGTPPSLLTFDQGGGTVTPITSMIPVGVHAWQGNLWLVGTSNSGPVIAPINSGGVGAVTTWSASLATASAIGGDVGVQDDRSLPSRTTTWSNVQTATGPFPFLHAHALTQQASGTTLWLFAGPSEASGGVTITSFAMAPVGVSYP